MNRPTDIVGAQLQQIRRGIRRPAWMGAGGQSRGQCAEGPPKLRAGAPAGRLLGPGACGGGPAAGCSCGHLRRRVLPDLLPRQPEAAVPGMPRMMTQPSAGHILGECKQKDTTSLATERRNAAGIIAHTIRQGSLGACSMMGDIGNACLIPSMVSICTRQAAVNAHLLRASPAAPHAWSRCVPGRKLSLLTCLPAPLLHSTHGQRSACSVPLNLVLRRYGAG